MSINNILLKYKFIIIFNAIIFIILLNNTNYLLEQDVDVINFSYLLAAYMPQSLYNFLLNVAIWRQQLYDKVTLKLLNIFIIKDLIILMHTCLFYFRIKSVALFEFIERYINLDVFMIILSVVCSRLHIAGYMIVGCLLFFRLDLAVMYMARFYKKYPLILDKNFPQINKGDKRSMWSKAAPLISEAAQNPKVQAVAVGIGGLVVWKALDVHDTYKQADIAEADRQTEANEREKDRQAEYQRHQELVQAEYQRHQEVVQAEANEREKDRQVDTKRLAFEKVTSPEYNELNNEQQTLINEVLKTGVL